MQSSLANSESITLDQYILYSIPTISSSDNKVVIADIYLRDFKNLKNKPKLVVSELTKLFQHYTVGILPINFASTSTTYGQLTEMLSQTTMYHYHPGAFQLLDVTILEVVAINWIIAHNAKLLNYTSKKDIERTRYNLRVLADWCGDYDDYLEFIPKLRKLNVDLGYIENQLEYIINEYSYAK